MASYCTLESVHTVNISLVAYTAATFRERESISGFHYVGTVLKIFSVNTTKNSIINVYIQYTYILYEYILPRGYSSFDRKYWLSRTPKLLDYCITFANAGVWNIPLITNFRFPKVYSMFCVIL